MFTDFTRHLGATAALAAFLAGCALEPPRPGAALPSEANAAGAPALDLRSKFGVPREGRKRDRAKINAEYQLALEADELGPPRASQIFRAHAQREAIVRSRERAGTLAEKSAGLQPSQWQALGPSNVGGRVRSLAFDPRNPARIFAGTASGGLWHSLDGGNSWRANNDFLPNLSVSTIVVDPANPDVMYLGTGEASAGLVGVGAFKSVDGGARWTFLAATSSEANADWRFVNRLAIHPQDSRVLLAGVTNSSRASGGIYRSEDAGATWTRVSTAKALDVAFDPRDPSRALAGLDDGMLAYSRDGGRTWARTDALVPVPSGRGETARAEIAFARSRAGLVYASVDNEKGEVWRSFDSGVSWEKTATPGHLNIQGDYDNAIWVDPTDANHVVVGGLDLYQSRDGGFTFDQVSDWRYTPDSPHADHHVLASPPDFGPARPVLYNGNDGGVYRAANVYAVNAAAASNGWTNTNNGLAVTQFYSGASRASAGGRVVGGTQDNGSLALSPFGAWSTFRGGDGGFVAVDPGSDQTVYGEYVYLAIHRTTFGGGSQYICTGILDALPAEEGHDFCGAGATKKANFIAPFVLDPNDRERLLAGGSSLWATGSARAAKPSWRSVKAPSAVRDNFISAIAVAEGNGNVIWVGHNNGEVYRTTNGLAFTPSWSRVGAGSLPARNVQRIMVDRDNHNRVIVAVTGFVANNLWQTLDGGATWTSITGNLPSAPIFDVKRHPSNAQWLYVGTSVGLFTSENGGATWSTTNEGPANIRVRELFWIDDATLGVATYGRGMFKTAVAAGGPANYQDLWWAGPQENGWGMSISQHRDLLFIGLYIYGADGRPTFAVIPGGTWNAGHTAYTGSIYIPSGSWYGGYDASRFDAGSPVGSGTVTFTSASTATFTYTIQGTSGSKSIQRQLFGPRDATPVATYGDLWWGGASQNGWGVAINQQYRMLFAVWYTYDTAGRPTWFVVPGGTWTAANVYTGTAYRTSGSGWLGAAYDASRFQPQPVGNVTFTFTDLHNATMAYQVDGLSGTLSIVRQPF